MDKAVHYTERERMLLAQLVFEEKAIENKKTNATDLKEKAEAWERITKKYISQGCTPRSSKQLKKCWDNMKQKKRKSNTTIWHERLMTGGGPPQTQVNDPVLEFMDSVNPNIDVELDCPFDSTAAYEKEYNVKMDYMSSKRKTIEDDNENEDEEENDINIINTYDRDIPSTFQGTPLEKEMTSKIKNMENIRDEKELRLTKIREAIKQQRELHAKRMKIAEAEEKIVLLKLLKEEEALRQSSTE